MENYEINRFFKVLSNCKLYIFFLLLLFLTMGYFYSFYYVTPMYKSSATVVLVQNSNIGKISSITQSDITLNQNLLSTYTKIAKSDKVLEQVIQNLNLNISVENLYKFVSVEAINNTEVFKISVINTNSSLAADITNELLNVFSNEVQLLYNMNNVYIMDLAEPSTVPCNINHIKDITIFGIIGLAISFLLVTIVYLLDTTIKCEQDIEQYANIPVLSTIPINKKKHSKNYNELIVNVQPKSPIAESFKTFRTNIMFSLQNKNLSTILVTSSTMGEGKTFISSNLAVTFAGSGKKVILIDADMRKGRLNKMFNVSNKIGLSNLLSNLGINGSKENINEYIQKTDISNLHLMTCGNVPPNPSELLSSANMKKLLEALHSQYDIIICDGTPCMLVSDSIILSKLVDTTVIVTANKVTKLDNLLKIKKSIEIVGGKISGAIINKMNINSKSYSNKYYYGNSIQTQNNIEVKVSLNPEILNNELHIKDVSTNDICNLKTYNTINELSDNIVDNAKIDELYNIVNENSISVQDAILSINNQLAIINKRFDLFEKKSYNNEFSLKDINKLNTATYNKYDKEKIIDVKKLNDKIIKIQDYLENDYNNYNVELDNTLSKTIISKNEVTKSTEHIDNTQVINEINDSIDIENKKGDSVINYNKAKNKQRRGLFSFINNRNRYEYDEDDEITIVSQILLNGKQESVG